MKHLDGEKEELKGMSSMAISIQYMFNKVIEKLMVENLIKCGVLKDEDIRVI